MQVTYFKGAVHYYILSCVFFPKNVFCMQAGKVLAFFLWSCNHRIVASGFSEEEEAHLLRLFIYLLLMTGKLNWIHA